MTGVHLKYWSPWRMLPQQPAAEETPLFALKISDIQIFTGTAVSGARKQQAYCFTVRLRIRLPIYRVSVLFALPAAAAVKRSPQCPQDAGRIDQFLDKGADNSRYNPER